MKSTLKKKLLVAAVGLALAAVVAEIGFRVVAPRVGIRLGQYERLGRFAWTGEGEYVPHPYSGFVRPPDADRLRAFGLADERRTQKSSMPRVLCLGASTTEGGNAKGWPGSYPALLQVCLANDHGIEIEVVNGGVSGWTSAETSTAYFLNYQDFAADVVLIHHAINDIEPMLAPGFRSDYSHWRVPIRDLRPALWERVVLRTSYLYSFATRATKRFNIDTATKVGALDISADPPSPALQRAAERTFARNIESVGCAATTNGAVVALLTMPFNTAWMNPITIAATETNNRILRETAASNEWLLVDLAADFKTRWDHESMEDEFLDAVHLTSEGNRRKAVFIAQQLTAAALLSDPDEQGK